MTHPIPRNTPSGAWRNRLVTVAALASLVTAFAALGPGRPTSARAAQQPRRVVAPELDGGAGWVGTDRPIRLRDLRGKIVVLDFWTSC